MISVLLSACLIVKNESMTLHKCLKSLKGVADEIIVVDTGSEDNTAEIAKACGAEVFNYQWDNHFGNARNESLRHAHGDFILFIDADSNTEITLFLWTHLPDQHVRESYRIHRLSMLALLLPSFSIHP